MTAFFTFAYNADDEYDPHFWESSLKFMEEASLDIAASGSEFIDAQSLRKLGIRRIPSGRQAAGVSYDRHTPHHPGGIPGTHG